MSVCVQLYNTGWDVFSIEILGGGVCLLCEKSLSLSIEGSRCRRKTRSLTRI